MHFHQIDGVEFICDTIITSTNFSFHPIYTVWFPKETRPRTTETSMLLIDSPRSIWDNHWWLLILSVGKKAFDFSARTTFRRTVSRVPRLSARSIVRPAPFHASFARVMNRPSGSELLWKVDIDRACPIESSAKEKENGRAGSRPSVIDEIPLVISPRFFCLTLNYYTSPVDDH